MSEDRPLLFQITSKYFCAGFVVVDNKIINGAPILLKFFRGKTVEYAKEICKKNGWKFEQCKTDVSTEF